jgi:hypothetical protein
VGLRAGYSAEALQIGSATYVIHDFDAALPLYFPAAQLTLIPSLGAEITDADLGAFGPADGRIRSAPHAGLDFGRSLGQYVYLNGGLSWGRKSETEVPESSSYYAGGAELNVSTALSFLKAYPFRYSSLRTYGKAEYVAPWPGIGGANDNWLFNAAQEFVIGVVRVDEPYVEVNVLGNFLLEHALDSESPFTDNYYAPDGVTVLSGGVMTSAWIPVGEENSLNLRMRITGGGKWERWFGDSPLAQLELEANVGFAKGDAYYYLTTAATGTFSGADFDTLSAWDYYSLYIGLGFSTQMPRLLAP